MTEHTYYECDVCGKTEEGYPQDWTTGTLCRVVSNFLKGVEVSDLCPQCTEKINESIEEAAEKRRGISTSKEG